MVTFPLFDVKPRGADDKTAVGGGAAPLNLRREVSCDLEDSRRERGVEMRAPGGESVAAEAGAAWRLPGARALSAESAVPRRESGNESSSWRQAGRKALRTYLKSVVLRQVIL